ncbi:MAG TPA: enoyl-CoA hydratase-related protein, partial [Verrucomicrobiae bacterium]|nr:enoyl-CoA hydratase-related protein [Verrucomicrobiae bacterium]
MSRDGAVLEIRFNRPAKKNAITNAMYGVMADAITEAEHSDDIRVVLFTAEGDFFSAGNDLMDFASQSSGAFSGPREVGRFLD